MPATWEYNSTQEWNRKTYHVWERPNPSFAIETGETVYSMTHQPPNGSRVDYVKPEGTGWVTREYLLPAGIEVVPNNARD